MSTCATAFRLTQCARLLAIVLMSLVAVPLGVQAQTTSEETPATEAEAASPVMQYVAPKTFEMLIGVRITAPDGNMYGTLATTVFPNPWPEQTVEIVEANLPPTTQAQFRDLPGGNRQWMFSAPTIPAGAVVEATVKVRITKSHIVGPEDTLHFKIPKRLSRDLQQFMSNSPYIEANAGEVRKIVRAVDASEPLTDWKKVEQLYDWVRDNITYQRGDLKTVREALRDKTGDCEEMTSTFVALCQHAVCGFPTTAIPSSIWRTNKARGIGSRAKLPALAILAQCPITCQSCKKGTASKFLKSRRSNATLQTSSPPRKYSAETIRKSSSFVKCWAMLRICALPI